ncbi:hypothetical protein KP509_07G043900 [Ceratopteris richardii]|uniref:Uncharacterized protein n=2 Tax=Ceratopteris richardii TaxID=49495 RepID=A0A8T2UGE9_CERRI|nr:hypothetical protein KP509_07G043900 [Ceratopteris richardii]
MGMEIPMTNDEQAVVEENWPRILLAGPPNVGKRSILQRLLAMGKVKGSPFSSSGIHSHGWMLETKYYTADVCISTASLVDAETRENAKAYVSSNQCQALVLIFDLSNFSTFDTIQEWVTAIDRQHLEILLCVGNKADRLPDHFAHREYRRRLQKKGESSSEPHPEFWDFGIQETDGSGLLSDKENSADQLRGICMDWCSEHGIEYLEACALDHLFDRCISIEGDSQGLNRVLGALSAHMWPGLNLKSQNEAAINTVMLEGSSDTDESEISIDYERLSNGSGEPWGGDEGPWTFYGSAPFPAKEGDASAATSSNWQPGLLSTEEVNASAGAPSSTQSAQDVVESFSQEDPSSDNGATSMSDTTESVISPTTTNEVHREQQHSLPSSNFDGSSGVAESYGVSSDEDTPMAHGNGRSHQAEARNFEQLMVEMSQMRKNGRLMPDSQRREMAANLALRMASLFDDDDDDDDDDDL